MIDPSYVQTMARYNAWQNSQITRIVEVMSAEELAQDRGAFFGSILGTLNHLLWADQIWMSRFSDTVNPPKNATKPGGGMPETTTTTPNIGVWSAERFTLDGKIRAWADGLRALDLTGDLSWYSGAAQKDMSVSVALCITHFLNHQTHHRGQVHAMLTAAGKTAPVSDLFFLPES